LVDVISYEKMMPDIRRTLVFSETFYSITLVLEGSDVIAVNGKSRRLKKGLIICSIPGEVWAFEAEPQIEALNLIFEKEFLLSFFSDPHFLDRFTYLQADRSSPFLMADDAAFERIHTLYQEMRREITDYAKKDQHILRAMLYETMMLLQRVPMVDAEQVGQDLHPRPDTGRSLPTAEIHHAPGGRHRRPAALRYRHLLRPPVQETHGDDTFGV